MLHCLYQWQTIKETKTDIVRAFIRRGSFRQLWLQRDFLCIKTIQAKLKKKKKKKSNSNNCKLRKEGSGIYRRVRYSRDKAAAHRRTFSTPATTKSENTPATVGFPFYTTSAYGIPAPCPLQPRLTLFHLNRPSPLTFHSLNTAPVPFSPSDVSLSQHCPDLVTLGNVGTSQNSLQRWQLPFLRRQEAESLDERGEIEEQLHPGQSLSQTHAATCGPQRQTEHFFVCSLQTLWMECKSLTYVGALQHSLKTL